MTGYKCFIIRYGEVALKGQNRPYFEKVLMERIKKILSAKIDIKLTKEDGLLIARTEEPIEVKSFLDATYGIFGIDTISPVFETDPDMGIISRKAVSYMKTRTDIKTFKVEVKRSNKLFPLTSPEIAREIGADILKGTDHLKVDVNNPDLELFIHVRHENVFIYDEKYPGFGGLPLGTNGKGMVLLSGGIDSPVAAFKMSRRGMRIEAVHFHSFPYTSQRAYEKVKSLATILYKYCGPIMLHSVNLLPIQEEIVINCKEEETTILVRWFMMKIAEILAKRTNCQVLITGENLGQVASQTVEAISVVDRAVEMAVMRPLISEDKVDIIDCAVKIGTYETSILPYEDCCQVFLPKHPKTKPKFKDIQKSLELLDDNLIEKAMETYKCELIKADEGGY